MTFFFPFSYPSLVPSFYFLFYLLFSVSHQYSLLQVLRSSPWSCLSFLNSLSVLAPWARWVVWDWPTGQIPCAASIFWPSPAHPNRAAFQPGPAHQNPDVFWPGPMCWCDLISRAVLSSLQSYPWLQKFGSRRTAINAATAALPPNSQTFGEPCGYVVGARSGLWGRDWAFPVLGLNFVAYHHVISIPSV